MIRVSLQYLWGIHRRDEVHHPEPWEFSGAEEHAVRLALLTLGEPDIASSTGAKLFVEDEAGVVGGWNRQATKRFARAFRPEVVASSPELRRLCEAINVAIEDDPHS